MLRLAVFLGNPGTQYKNNRHNAAWMLAEVLPFYQSLDWQKKFKGLYAARDDIHFIKPQTYMNLSGESARAAASFYKIELENIIVIHDEIELPFGTLSLKFAGGLGGHNGLRSMKACFGSADFWRLRIGIGRPDSRLPGKGGNPESALAANIADWVLADFTEAETQALAPVLATGARLLAKALAVEPQTLLPEWAKKNCIQSGNAGP